MGNKRPPKRDIPDKKPHLFLAYLESRVRPTDGDGIYQLKEDLFLDWQKLNNVAITNSYDKYIAAPKSVAELLPFSLYEKKKIFDRAILSACKCKKYPGKYKQALRPYEAKNYTDLERRNDITNARFELRYIACVGMWLAYAMVSSDFGKASYISDVVRDCMDKLGISSVWMKKFRYEKENEESIENIFLLTLATALRVLFEAQREENMDVPSSKNNEDILWLLEVLGMIEDCSAIPDRQENECVDEDYQIIEEKIIRYVWDRSVQKTNIFDRHSSLSVHGREDFSLSDYYCVPSLKCNKQDGFILEQSEAPIRSILCSPSGYGKSTLYDILLHLCTLELAKKHSLVSEKEERAYRKIQKELLNGRQMDFPQFLPVVITARLYGHGRVKGVDFIDIFAQELFPIDDLTPESEVKEKEKYRNAFRQMLSERTQRVIFFVDAYDEIRVDHRPRFVDMLAEISDRKNSWNILLSYRPFIDENHLTAISDWNDYTKWQIEDLNHWGIHSESGKSGLWLMIRKYTEYLSVEGGEEADRYADRLYERMLSSPMLKAFSCSPYLTAVYTDACFENREYRYRTTYEIVRDVVTALIGRFNYDNNVILPRLTKEDFRIICTRVALNLLRNEKNGIPASKLSSVFSEVNLHVKDKDLDKHFSDMILCEEINVKTGILVNSDKFHYEFQGNDATLVFLAAHGMCAEIYNIKKKFGIEAVREEIEEIFTDLSELNPNHYMFIPMLVAAVCDRSKTYQENNIRSTDRSTVCQIVQEEARTCGLNKDTKELVQRVIMDESFAKNVLQ